MTRTIHRTLFVALAFATIPATGIPATGFAQPAPRAAAVPPAAPPPAVPPVADADPQTTQDKEVLGWAEQLATEASQLIERWITTQAISEDRVFARLYFPIAKTEPQKYATPYDALAEHDLVGPEDKALSRATTIQYAIVTDSNGYVPAHNTRFAQPLTGNVVQDYKNNQTKRMFGDPTSLAAARNEARHWFQRTRLENGDVIYDLSVPITVRGKHWGCVRIGYRRTE
jgi:methyl-accepting chemotaxis protein